MQLHSFQPSVTPCTSSPCKNGGTCKITGDDSHSCQCAEGFYGDNCEKGTYGQTSNVARKLQTKSQELMEIQKYLITF